MTSIATKIPAELKRQVDAAIAQYPPERKRSAALPLLHLWQEHFSFISDEGIHWIANKLELQPINILELVTFYPMLRQKSAAKTHRSEEHTSELQSLRHLVCRLLLEK